MKHLLLSILFISTALFSSAQEAEELTCLQKYQQIFEKRGSNHVPDGMERNVIVSVSDKFGTNCFYGKARVEGNKVTSIFIKVEDESYELFESKDFKTPYGAPINNAISEPWVTKEGKTMQVVFIDYIKPKKKQYMKAPDPDPDKL